MDSSMRDVADWISVAIAVVVVTIGLVAGWRSFMGGLRRGLHPERFRRTQAQVIDVGVFDTHDSDEHVTRYRVLVRFTVETGEVVAADMTLVPTQAQKDMLLIDHWLTIEHEVAEPEKFRFVWAAGVHTPDGAPKVEAEPVEEKSTGIYAPRP
jgi:hypothetical protein